MNPNEDGAPHIRPTLREVHVPPPPTKKQALEDFLSDYHDERHTGTYVECDGCTQVWMFFTDNPSFYKHL